MCVDLNLLQAIATGCIAMYGAITTQALGGAWLSCQQASNCQAACCADASVPPCLSVFQPRIDNVFTMSFAGGATPKDACKVCPVGTWSPGGSTQPCISCGFGYSSPEGSKSQQQCVPVNACPAGTEYRDGAVDRAFSISDCVCRPGFGSPTGSGICRLCPAGTFGPGGSLEDCYPCPFGTTSGEGAQHSHECRPVEQACPIGQYAPADAVSVQECRCYRGFGGGWCNCGQATGSCQHAQLFSQHLCCTLAGRQCSAWILAVLFYYSC